MDATHLHERAKGHLQKAIKTMREACDAAERSCNEDKPAEACQRVLHAFAWGMANASSSIETAMSAVEDAHVVERMAIDPQGAAQGKKE